MHEVYITPEVHLPSFQETRESLQSRQRQAYNAGKTAWRDDRINGQALQLYEELVRRVGANTYCWIGEETLATELGRSASTIKRWMRQLVAAHLIRRDRQFGHSTHTYITAYDQRDITEGTLQEPAPFVGSASDPSIRSDLLLDPIKDQNFKLNGGGGKDLTENFEDTPTIERLQDEGVTNPIVLDELQHRSIDDIDTVIRYVARCRDRQDPRRAGLIVHLLRRPERLPTRRSRSEYIPHPQPCQNNTPEAAGGLTATWTTILERLSQQIPAESFTTWLRPTALLHLDSVVAVIGAPNVFVRDELENFRDALTSQLHAEVGQTVSVEFAIGTG